MRKKIQRFHNYPPKQFQVLALNLSLALNLNVLMKKNPKTLFLIVNTQMAEFLIAWFKPEESDTKTSVLYSVLTCKMAEDSVILHFLVVCIVPS